MTGTYGTLFERVDKFSCLLDSDKAVTKIVLPQQNKQWQWNTSLQKHWNTCGVSISKKGTESIHSI